MDTRYALETPKDYVSSYNIEADSRFDNIIFVPLAGLGYKFYQPKALEECLANNFADLKSLKTDSKTNKRLSVYMQDFQDETLLEEERFVSAIKIFNILKDNYYSSKQIIYDNENAVGTLYYNDADLNEYEVKMFEALLTNNYREFEVSFANDKPKTVSTISGDSFIIISQNNKEAFEELENAVALYYGSKDKLEVFFVDRKSSPSNIVFMDINGKSYASSDSVDKYLKLQKKNIER